MYTLSDVLDMCQKITEETQDDAFFDYYGHINSFSVSVYAGRWANNKKPHYPVFLDDVNQENIDLAMKNLEKIYKEGKSHVKAVS